MFNKNVLCIFYVQLSVYNYTVTNITYKEYIEELCIMCTPCLRFEKPLFLCGFPNKPNPCLV